MKEVVGWFLFGVVIMSVAIGLGSLLKWDATRDARDRREQCAKIAQLSKATYHSEKNYTCTMLIDGKVEQVDV